MPVIFDFLNQTGRKTIARNFRLYKEQAELLQKEPYTNNASALVRLLLDEYFADRVPNVKIKFNALLKKSESNKKFI